jgi:hypothetical protein
VKTNNLKLTRAALLALVAGLSLPATSPGWADNTPTARALASTTTNASMATRLAWDRVGSQERTFV